MGGKVSKSRSTDIPNIHEARQLEEQRHRRELEILEHNVKKKVENMQIRIRTCMESGLYQCEVFSPSTFESNPTGDAENIARTRIILSMKEKGYVNAKIEKRIIERPGVIRSKQTSKQYENGNMIREYITWDRPTDIVMDKNNNNKYDNDVKKPLQLINTVASGSTQKETNEIPPSYDQAMNPKK